MGRPGQIGRWLGNAPGSLPYDLFFDLRLSPRPRRDLVDVVEALLKLPER